MLLELLRRMTDGGAALEVLDTHAGAGAYDLMGEAAQRSGEAEAGIRRLMADADAPSVFTPLKEAVRMLNQGGPVRFYPGSPWLAASGLRRGDRYVGCELRPDDHAALVASLRGASGPELSLEQRDGFEAAIDLALRRPRSLLLIDPPYERGDDYARIAVSLAAALLRRRELVAAIWAPIKDLETFDALLRRLEGLGFQAGLAAETRLRPLTNPMRLNGCAMILVASGEAAAWLGELASPFKQACDWAAAAAGEPGGGGRVEVWAD